MILITKLHISIKACCGCGPGSAVSIATGYGLDGPGIKCRWGARFSAPVQTGPGTHPASYTMGNGCYSGVKGGRSVTLTSHHLLVPWSRKSRAIPLLPLLAVRPVQSLSACTRVHFTFTFHAVDTTSTSAPNGYNRRGASTYTVPYLALLPKGIRPKWARSNSDYNLRKLTLNCIYN